MTTETQFELDWQERGTYKEATVGKPEEGDGVTFTIEYRATCYRRGPFLLRIEVANGKGHLKWGCFDEQDQPVRNYHNLEALEMEANSIARVLLRDRGPQT